MVHKKFSFSYKNLLTAIWENWNYKSCLFKKYFMTPKCSAINEEMFCTFFYY